MPSRGTVATTRAGSVDDGRCDSAISTTQRACDRTPAGVVRRHTRGTAGRSPSVGRSLAVTGARCPPPGLSSPGRPSRPRRRLRRPASGFTRRTDCSAPFAPSTSDRTEAQRGRSLGTIGLRAYRARPGAGLVLRSAERDGGLSLPLVVAVAFGALMAAALLFSPPAQAPSAPRRTDVRPVPGAHLVRGNVLRRGAAVVPGHLSHRDARARWSGGRPVPSPLPAAEMLAAGRLAMPEQELEPPTRGS